MDKMATKMSPGPDRDIVTTGRYIHQNQTLAIQDVYDALIELITNADDRYQILGGEGRIEIEVERKRGDTPSTIRVRDFADGMTLAAMDRKIGKLGDRHVSGMADGQRVRGTMSRGAKDVAVLGGVVFESIAEEDGRYHKCEITSRAKYRPYTPSQRATAKIRKSLGIPEGTGALVTLYVSSVPVPQHDQLLQKLPSLVALRDIVSSADRTIVLRDLRQDREDVIEPSRIQGEIKLKVRFPIPEYPGVEAKLVVKRAPKRFEVEQGKFRQSGILLQSEHGIHEATYFDASLDSDPHALWFFGRLKCRHIDQLWNEYDERWEENLPHAENNPAPIVNPLRKHGLRRDHPFTRALFRAALQHFRPLVEAERKRAERDRTRIESDETRKRLNKLQDAAAKFMQKHLATEEFSKGAEERDTESAFVRNGFALMPRFAQLIQGQRWNFSLKIWQESYPELAVGDTVEITCLTKEVSSSKRYAQLELHPTQQGVIRCVWMVTAELPTKATGIQVRVGQIVDESTIEVLESEAQRYEDVTSLSFRRKRYSMVVGKRRYVEVLAPCPEIVGEPTPVEISCSDRAFRIKGEKVLRPHKEWGVAICKVRVDAQEAERSGKLVAKLGDQTATAEIRSRPPAGAPIEINVVDKEFGTQRSKWSQNVLEIGARHPSVQRYLGPSPAFPGQEQKHFRVLLAEIVSEAVCGRVLGELALENPDWQGLDWEAYYATYTKLMTEILPVFHELQVAEP